jgi:hypothetical protein
MATAVVDRSGTDVIWEERITRGVATALMSNFKSAADALNELVDNAVNYRWGQQLHVSVSYDRKDLLVVESDGGRGMGASEIGTWLCWGEGDSHGAMDISRYHQGGKAASGFLGNKVRMWAKHKGENEVWLFEDEDWAQRSAPKNYGAPVRVAQAALPATMRSLDLDRGHVRIEISRLKSGRSKNLQVLGKHLASTYKVLLEEGKVSIEVDGQPVLPLAIPLSTAVDRVEIEVKLSKGRSAHGWAGRLNKAELTSNLGSGLRLLHSGRLICDGEWFGYNHSGKGALDSLIGELHLERFTPIPNKTNFMERSDDVWEELSAGVKQQLQPLIAELRAGADERRVTKKEKQVAREVSEELGRVLASAFPGSGDQSGAEGSEPGPGGRRPPREGTEGARPRNPTGRDVGKTPRTAPPEGAVGNLARLIARINGGDTTPPIRIRAWGSSQRSAWVKDDGDAGRQWLDINKNYPIYVRLGGDKAYVAESAILQLCEPREGESMSAAEYSKQVQLWLWKWAIETGGDSDLADDEPDDNR